MTNSKESCTSAQYQHIASCNGDGLSYRVARWRWQQQHGCDNIICCQQAAPRAHAHELHIAKAICMSAQAVGTSRLATATSTRPHVQAHDNTSSCTVATVTRPCAKVHNNTSRCMAAMATRPCAQAHDNMSRHTAAMATRPCAQAHNNTSCRTAATATRPTAQAHDNMLHCTAATTTRTGATKTTKSSTKPCIHVASHGGNNDNNCGNDDDEC
jgi:hypothetical protein